MNRFLIKHAFNLKSANRTLLLPGQYVSPKNEAEEAELKLFAKDGSCQELVSTPQVVEKTEQAPADPNQDLSTVKGVGKGALEKLASKGITTVDQLKAALVSKEEEMKEVFGVNMKKVQAQFSK